MQSKELSQSAGIPLWLLRASELAKTMAYITLYPDKAKKPYDKIIAAPIYIFSIDVKVPERSSGQIFTQSEVHPPAGLKTEVRTPSHPAAKRDIFCGTTDTETVIPDLELSVV